MFMQVKLFWHLIKHKLLYANLIIYSVTIILVLMFHQDIMWSKEMLQGYMWSGVFPPAADMKLFNKAVKGIRADESVEHVQSILEQSLEINPDSSARMLLGVCYAKQGEYDKALACFNQYRSIYPSDISNYIQIINILKQKQDYEAINQLLTDGIKHFSRRIKLYLPHPDPNASRKEFNIKAVMIYEKSQKNLNFLKETQKQLEISKQ